MSKGHVSIIEITEAHVKFLQAKRARFSRIVTTAVSRQLSVYSDEEIVKSIKSLIPAKQLRTEEFIFAIPRRLSILKHVSLPSHSDAEINKMVNLQIGNNIPFSKEDVVFDYVPIEKRDNGYTDVLLIVVHKDVTSRLLKIARAAGIEQFKFTLSSLGLLTWYLFQVSRKAQQGGGAVVLLNVDFANSEICFINQKRLIFSRNISYGVQDFHEESFDNFLKQLYMTLGNYKREKMGPDIAKIILISKAPDVAFVQEKLSADYQIPVDVMKPLDNIPRQKGMKLSSLPGTYDVADTVGLGLLFSDPEKTIDLIPEEFSSSKETSIRRRHLQKLILNAILACVLVASVFSVDVYRKTVYLNQLEDKNEALLKRVDQTKNLAKIVGSTDGSFSDRIMLAELFYTLYKITPEDIAFKSVDIDASGWVTIHGYSVTGTSVNNFQTNLVNSAIFRDVTLQYATKLKIFRKNLTDFKIKCRMGVVKKESR